MSNCLPFPASDGALPTCTEWSFLDRHVWAWGHSWKSLVGEKQSNPGMFLGPHLYPSSFPLFSQPHQVTSFSLDLEDAQTSIGLRRGKRWGWERWPQAQGKSESALSGDKLFPDCDKIIGRQIPVNSALCFLEQAGSGVSWEWEGQGNQASWSCLGRGGMLNKK